MKPDFETGIPTRSRLYDLVKKTGLKTSQITQIRWHGHNMTCDRGTTASSNIGRGLKKFVYKSNNLEIRLSLIENEPETRSQLRPNQTRDWVGSHSDLVELATNPALLKDDWTKKNAAWQFERISLSTPIIEKHNYFNTIKPPKFNKRSEALRKNVWGRTKTKWENWKTKIFEKYLTEPVKTQEKTQTSLMIWKNIKMVITGLEIKTKKVITLVNIW